MKYLMLLFNLMLINACDDSSSISSGGQGGRLDGAVYAEADLEEMIVEDIAYDDAILQRKATSPKLKREQKIIKTGNLRFETQDLKKTRTSIVTALKNAKAYIQKDNSGKTYNTEFENLTIRLPSQNFDQLLSEISEGIAYFEEKTISQRDVTEEFVDINARLKAKRALENRYLELLKKAKDVKEMLQIERELANIREEIESREGRLKYLQSQVSESTLHIYFYKTTVKTGVTASYGSKIINALKNGWNGISIFFLGLLTIWPFLILVGAGVFFMRRWIVKNKK